MITQGADGRPHLRALRTSSALTGYYLDMYRPEATMVRPQKVIRLLREGGVSFVLMGTHGIGGWRGKARATEDVDVLVTKRDHAKAVRILQEAYPKLIVDDRTVVTRFKDPETGDSVIDVMKPAQTVFKMVFRYTVTVADEYRIPDLEMALVSKFAAMVSPNREPEDKMIDGGDFHKIAKHNMASIDLAKLRRLASKVYRGGGAEIMRLIGDVKAGRKLTF